MVPIALFSTRMPKISFTIRLISEIGVSIMCMVMQILCNKINNSIRICSEPPIPDLPNSTQAFHRTKAWIIRMEIPKAVAWILGECDHQVVWAIKIKTQTQEAIQVVPPCTDKMNLKRPCPGLRPDKVLVSNKQVVDPRVECSSRGIKNPELTNPAERTLGPQLLITLIIQLLNLNNKAIHINHSISSLNSKIKTEQIRRCRLLDQI